ncbi:hypothetical protein [Staphylococcus capitis]|uniref:Uncharacterized protein n=1 Tax=Staphylococcus capitis TaxID=29388 RepID=A0ABX1SNY7_STACP|nr:hypothetical protein [Staphylococcus capitis]NMK54021.1 hypothetical protein [Staphylococcus capitis]NMK69287.1 hypothetical protein [Staphylococcus capitis]
MAVKEPKTSIIVKLTGEDSNTLHLASIVASALKKHGFRDLALEVRQRVFEMSSQDEAIQMFMEYVEVV